MSIEYELIRSKRKTVSIQIDTGKVIVKAPMRYPQYEITKFVKTKEKWISKHLDISNNKPFFSYTDGEIFHYLGEKKILWIKERALRQSVEIQGDAIIVSSHRKKDDYENNKKIIDRWITKQAKEILTTRYDELFDLFSYRNKPELFIRSFKSRWGAYHKKFLKDYIKLNKNLIMYPMKCIDYVIIHELAHKKHQNHSKKFYDFIEEKYPKWKEAKKLLDGKVD